MKNFISSLIQSFVLLVAIFVVFWFLNKIEVDGRGLKNVLENPTVEWLSFVNFFALDIYNVAYSILILVLVVYIIYSLFKDLGRRKMNV